MGYLGTKPSNSPLTSELIPNSIITNAKINDVAATKLTGQVPDANAPSGSVIQVVQGTTTTQVTSTAYQTAFDTGLSASITPISSTSKILVIANQAWWQQYGSNATIYGHIKLLRGSTEIHSPSVSENVFGGSMQEIGYRQTITVLDSPATTSSITYKTQGYIREPNGSQLVFQRNGASGLLILMEIAG